MFGPVYVQMGFPALTTVLTTGHRPPVTLVVTAALLPFRAYTLLVAALTIRVPTKTTSVFTPQTATDGLTAVSQTAGPPHRVVPDTHFGNTCEPVFVLMA